MALTLQDFQVSSLTLADFEGQYHIGKTPNEKTARQIAATQTLNRAGSVEDYDMMKARLLDPQAQGEFTLEHQRMRDGMWENFVTPGIPDIIADENTPVEEKDRLISSILTPQGVRPMSSMSTLAYQAAAADLPESTPEAVEQARLKYIDLIEEVVQEKRRTQAAINSIKMNRGIMGTVTDLAGVVTPFREWNWIDVMLRDVTGQGLAERGHLLGEQKEALYNVIQGLPMHERAAFTERLLDYIGQNEGVILPDGNDLIAFETLNRMLVNNDYSDIERWFDNITSILDVVGVGAAVRGAPRGARAARATRLEQEAEQFAGRAPEDLGPLAREAEAFRATDELGPLADEATAFTPEQPNLGSLGVEASEFRPAADPTPDDLFKAMAETTRTEVSPTSPSQVVKDANPELAREMHTRAITDPTDETAQGLYGTTKTEAMAKDILPEPEIREGSMPNKVEMGPATPEPEAIRAQRTRQGNLEVSDAEWGKVESNLRVRVSDVEGMELHKSSLVIRTNPDATFGVTARYSPTDSGFSTWDEALERAKYAFRNYGLQDENFIPLARQGDKWIETTPEDIATRQALTAAGARGKAVEDIDFAVGLKFDYRFRPEDLEVEDVMITAPGRIARLVQQADRLDSQILARMGQGSLVQNVLDPAAVIHPRVVEAGHVAFDRAAGLKRLYQDEFNKFIKPFEKLSKDRKALMSDYIHEANLEGIPLTVSDLYRRGFSASEIEMLKQWRRANDALWYATNDDMAKTLRSRGMQVYVDDASNSKFIGTPVSQHVVSSRSDIYDSVEGVVKNLRNDEIDNLYESGGQILRLEEPVEVDGQWFEFVLSRNTPNQGYLRSIYEGEVIMPYREGYYPVMYDANYFIEQTVRMKDGTTRQRVIASARDKGEVNEALKALRSKDPNAEYSSRPDRSRRDPSDVIFDGGTWAHITNAGMSSQKVRGERLMAAGTDMHKFGQGHLKDPLEAVANQVHILSQRVSARNFMETSQHRWMQNYGEYLDLPINPRTGKVDFPDSVLSIKGKEGVDQSLVADARTAFNYLYSLQNGYINGIDAGLKSVLWGAADLFAGLGMHRTERAFLAGSTVSPVRGAKSAAFKLLISANPFRQAVIQRAQMFLLGVANPRYASTEMVQDLLGINGARMGVVRSGKYKDMWSEIEHSGIIEAVDAHNFLREDAFRLADLTVSQRVRSTASAPFDFMQKWGFDAAEQDVLISAWLAFRDQAIRAGKDIKNQRVQDEILGQARAFTGGMNRAGDMPYGNNTFAIAAQFFSFQHKMMLMPFTNRSLTPMKRAQLMAYSAALFGTNGIALGALLDQTLRGQDSFLATAIKDGILDLLFNESLSLATGTEQAIDLTDIAPVQIHGFGNFIVGALTGGLFEMLAESPSGSLLFGNNPRVADAMKTAARYFNIIDDYEDEELNTTYRDVALGAAHMFSGFSNTFKARYAWHTGRKMSTSGAITDESVTRVEATLGLLGFQTKTESGYRKTYEEIFGTDYDGNSLNADVIDWYRELKRQLAREGTTTHEDDMSMRILSEAWRVFGDERPRAIDILVREIEKDAQDKDVRMFETLYRRIGLATDEEVWKMVEQLPAGNVKDQITNIMNTRGDFDGR